MRIDLALQCIQFTLPSLILFQYDLLHQRINLLVGFLDRMPQMPDLLRSADIDLRLLARLIFFD